MSPLAGDYVKLMQPILTKQDRDELMEAGLVIFDYGMSEGNKYILHIPKLLELIRSSTPSANEVEE